MRRTTRVLTSALAAAAAVASAPMPPADGADAALRIGVVLPAGDVDAAYGVSLAVAASNDAKSAGAKRSAVETVPLTATDAASATSAIDKAAKEKWTGVVAFTSEAIAVDLEAAARKAKVPLVEIGASGPTRTLDATDPVFHVEPSPADYGLHVAELLRLRSGKSSVGLPSETRKAVVLYEETTPPRPLASPIVDNDVGGVVSPASASPGEQGVASAREQKADRLVVLGGAAVARGVVAALDKAAWDVPILAEDTALDGAPWKCKAAFVAAVPTWSDEKHVDEIVAKHPPAAGRSAQLTPAAMRGFVAAAALIDAALNAGKHGVVGALRDLREGSGAKEWPLFDGTGCVDRWRWSTWATSADGIAAPIKPAWLPDAALGPYLGGKAWTRFWHHGALPPGPVGAGMLGDTVVRVGFGGDAVTPRTIDADLATIGLAKTAGPAYELALDQILARICGKLSRVWSKNYDGSRRAALSFKIFFVPETAPAAAPEWEAVISGDGPDGLHGGQSFPKIHRAQALSTYLLRNAKLLHDAKLDPPLSAADLVYLDGSYAWNTSAEGNARSDKVRALLDGAASTFCMKLSKQLGELAGLSVDFSGEPRSIMVAKGGEGVSDEFAYFPPAFAKILEKTLGRVGAEGK